MESKIFVGATFFSRSLGELNDRRIARLLHPALFPLIATHPCWLTNALFKISHTHPYTWKPSGCCGKTRLPQLTEIRVGKEALSPFIPLYLLLQSPGQKAQDWKETGANLFYHTTAVWTWPSFFCWPLVFLPVTKTITALWGFWEHSENIFHLISLFLKRSFAFWRFDTHKIRCWCNLIWTGMVWKSSEWSQGKGDFWKEQWVLAPNALIVAASSGSQDQCLSTPLCPPSYWITALSSAKITVSIPLPHMSHPIPLQQQTSLVSFFFSCFYISPGPNTLSMDTESHYIGVWPSVCFLFRSIFYGLKVSP